MKKDIFLKQTLNIQNIYLIFIKILISQLKERKLKNARKLFCNTQYKENSIVPIRALKQALHHRLILKKLFKVIQFNQEAWLKPYIDMNTKVKTDAKNDFEKYFFTKLMNNAVFGKTMENVRKQKDISNNR